MIYAPEAVTLYPWFAPTKVGGSLVIDTGQRGNGYWQTTARYDSKAWTESLKPGTYTVIDFGFRAGYVGISHLSNGGADVTTIDHYGGAAYNITFSASAALTSGTIELSADSKNASASDYHVLSTFVRLTRTGD